ncbi:MAG: beta-N-acetylhexosaminidase [Zoogloeaceae bacterium]|nr:beta-N-acetylhexosaminidase [Zoogloeaceae bacterium]
MIDVAGLRLTDRERERLRHPLVGGVILFARNYANPEQLRALTREIHAARAPRLLIAIDHEGGRVQRCRAGFTALPPMRRLGACRDADPQAAERLAEQVGYVLAAELLAVGVDFSFTPVLDLDHGHSGVIGDRAFHRDPDAVIALARALIRGLRQAGMGCCGKHFPGHGWAEADSHLTLPVDERDLAALEEDLRPFRALPLDAVMPAHVVYPRVDARTACFSPVWHEILRKDIGFQGVIFSDDLSMEGAGVAGDTLARAQAAYHAGCDMLLICNAPEKAAAVLEQWPYAPDPVRGARIARVLPETAPAPDLAALRELPAYQAAREAILALGAGSAMNI